MYVRSTHYGLHNSFSSSASSLLLLLDRPRKRWLNTSRAPWSWVVCFAWSSGDWNGLSSALCGFESRCGVLRIFCDAMAPDSMACTIAAESGAACSTQSGRRGRWRAFRNSSVGAARVANRSGGGSSRSGYKIQSPVASSCLLAGLVACSKVGLGGRCVF